jgi:hypothetical protein
MQNITTTTATSRDGMVGTPKKLAPKHDAGTASRGATPRSNTTRPGRHVNARDLHPGDVMQQYDWSLHVRDVEVSHDAVAIAVSEFGFPLHYAADEQIRLAA